MGVATQVRRGGFLILLIYDCPYTTSMGCQSSIDQPGNDLFWFDICHSAGHSFAAVILAPVDRRCAILMPINTSGAVPRLTSSSTPERPEAHAAATATVTCAGLVTGARLSEMITSPRCSPLPEAEPPPRQGLSAASPRATAWLFIASVQIFIRRIPKL